MRKRVLFIALCLAGCASQGPIPEVSNKPVEDCGLAALAADSTPDRGLGSCSGALQQLDDGPRPPKKR